MESAPNQETHLMSTASFYVFFPHRAECVDWKRLEEVVRNQGLVERLWRDVLGVQKKSSA